MASEIYIVYYGEHNEGSSVLGVYSSMENATIAANNYMGKDIKSYSKKKDDEDYKIWECTRDYVEITICDIDDPFYL